MITPNAGSAFGPRPEGKLGDFVSEAHHQDLAKLAIVAGMLEGGSPIEYVSRENDTLKVDAINEW